MGDCFYFRSRHPRHQREPVTAPLLDNDGTAVGDVETPCWIGCTQAGEVVIDVKFAGTTVRLFFSKRGRNGHWNGLLTTDLSLSFLKAYRTYATRWTTEVAYHDCKQLLDFGRCQSVHFSVQIASFTLTMMQYNILCMVKRFEAYETVGTLFREATAGTLELSAADRIWELILDTILEIAEMISADASELLSAVIDANPKFHKLYQMYKSVA